MRRRQLELLIDYIRAGDMVILSHLQPQSDNEFDLRAKASAEALAMLLDETDYQESLYQSPTPHEREMK